METEFIYSCLQSLFNMNVFVEVVGDKPPIHQT